jgi:hypothetical protein
MNAHALNALHRELGDLLEKVARSGEVAGADGPLGVFADADYQTLRAAKRVVARLYDWRRSVEAGSGAPRGYFASDRVSWPGGWSVRVQRSSDKKADVAELVGQAKAILDDLASGHVGSLTLAVQLLCQAVAAGDKP